MLGILASNAWSAQLRPRLGLILGLYYGNQTYEVSTVAAAHLVGVYTRMASDILMSRQESG